MSLYPHRARKRFGQNFLHDEAIISRIVRSIAPTAGEHLLEIGPGQGALTAVLIASGAQLDAVELDRDLIAPLLLRFGHQPNFTLHQADALSFELAKVSTEPSKLRVVGNLPYNISTPLIFHLLSSVQLIKDMHFMLQKEVVERLTAKPGSGDWGRLSLMVQYYCEAQYLFTVPPSAFRPEPKVESAIVRLTPHLQLPHPAKDIRLLERLLCEAFGQRRKMLRSSLSRLLDINAITAAEVDASLRPEQLDLAAFVRLADQLAQQSA